MSDHVCNPQDCPDGANYFVTCVDAGSVWYMAGPYLTHREALASVNRARDIGVANNGRAYFYGWGTVKSTRTEPGSITKAGLI